MPQTAPYGSWKSPITSELIVAETIGLGGTQIDGDDIYWVEARPREKGRQVVVRRAADGATRDVTPAPFYARTRVHEYGGKPFLAVNGALYFSNFADQRLYRQKHGGAPEPLTPETPLRYADGIHDSKRDLLFCIREDHTRGGEATNTIVKLNPNGDADGGTVIVTGNNFYSSPRLSPEGARLAWLTWNHPNMPWDGCELWVGELNADGTVRDAKLVAGGRAESIFQPEWSPAGVLYFISDRSGWWNFYCACDRNIESLSPMDAEFGQPQWNFGSATYGFESATKIICTYTRNGFSHLARLDLQTRQLKEIETPYTHISALRVNSRHALFIAGSATEPLSIVLFDLASRKIRVLRRASENNIGVGYLSAPQAIEFPTENGLSAHAFYYAPRNRDYSAPAGDQPPLIVKSHGGPTGATVAILNLQIQYWTSRGFAVVDVNYGGSTGYGRAYRQRLNNQWGIVDVDDCVNAARFLVAKNLADGKRLAITGGSAGGYTTLAALTFKNVFHAGASHFGVSDLEALAKETHKFESRYLDNLVGAYPARRDLYIARSPIHHARQINSALILFQGLDDPIVPPNQSEKMFIEVRNRELPAAYVTFAGEQHGFRRAENIRRALDGELFFYSKIFKFELADAVEPVVIENL